MAGSVGLISVSGSRSPSDRWRRLVPPSSGVPQARGSQGGRGPIGKWQLEALEAKRGLPMGKRAERARAVGAEFSDLEEIGDGRIGGTDQCLRLALSL